MLSCLVIKKKLYQYVENKLEASEESKVSSHLAKCPSCSRCVQDIKKIFASLKKVEQPFLSEVFWRKFDERLDMRLIEERAKPESFSIKLPSLPRLRFAGVAVMVTCLFLLVISLALNNYLKQKVAVQIQEPELYEAALFLDELEGVSLNHDEEAYLEEAVLQMELEQA